MLSLPRFFVYVYYEDGKSENVANSDTLTYEEALQYKDYWEKGRRKKVIRVTLEDRGGMCRRCHNFN
ncbi:MAG: hypothetical protein IJW78_04910 [Clostridia bacterium]|nr:hypothetical protein [Clostridia bacterium]